ncbi:hypothetical protein VM1G_11572 [Cytospora mali]|uniref:Uncharacterized protein n=1 Tax=Cytospora mali TaxID=578113 RepID=A0A194VVW8_CYTMA|nr:hypothetical protein VM1G_11572 [Valsa mali]
MHIPAQFYQRASTATSWDVELADDVAICIAGGVTILVFIVLAVVISLAGKNVLSSGPGYNPMTNVGPLECFRLHASSGRKTDFAQDYVSQYGTISGAHFFAKRYWDAKLHGI